MEHQTDAQTGTRDPSAASALWESRQWTNDTVNEVAALDAMTPGCWWTPATTASPSDAELNPVHMLVAARLADDQAFMWASAILGATVVNLPSDLVDGAIARARMKTGDETGTLLAELVESIPFVDDPGDPDLDNRLTQLLDRAARNPAGVPERFTLRDSISSDPIVDVDVDR